MLSVLALGLQAGSGGDVVSNGGADVVAMAEGPDVALDGTDVAVDGWDDVAPPAHGCGARAQVGGSKATTSAAVAGVPG